MLTAITPHILALAGDPGGANALAPVLKILLAEKRCTLTCYAYRQAIDLWRKHDIPCATIEIGCDPSGLLVASQADLLLTATSSNGEDWEIAFISAANAMNIPSLALLDFWSNYLSRFSDNGGELHFPRCIAVMDDAAVSDMVALGFRAETLVVTGQPAFDALPEAKAAFTDAARDQLRQQLAGNSDWVVFASQPLASFYQGLTGNPKHLGFDEDNVLGVLLAALDELAELRPIRLSILPHPRENPTRFAGVQGQRVQVNVVTSVLPYEVLMSADLVVGMNSMLLVEACLLGCLVVSLQPGLVGPDLLPTNRYGASVPIFESEGLALVLGKLLCDSNTRQTQLSQLANWRPLPGAARRVADLAYRMSMG